MNIILKTKYINRDLYYKYIRNINDPGIQTFVRLLWTLLKHIPPPLFFLAYIYFNLLGV